MICIILSHLCTQRAFKEVFDLAWSAIGHSSQKAMVAKTKMIFKPPVKYYESDA